MWRIGNGDYILSSIDYSGRKLRDVPVKIENKELDNDIKMY